MNNKLQNNEMYLPGDLGSIKIGNADRKIKSIFKGSDGATTITIGEYIQPLVLNGHKSGLGIILPEKTIELQ